MNPVIEVYVVAAGSVLIIMAIFEISMPERAFSYYSRYVSFRFFPLHGILLIILGFPMIIYRGHLSTVIFIIGVITVLTGPFIIIYPEKIRNLFQNITEEMTAREIKRFIYADAMLRLILGTLFITGAAL